MARLINRLNARKMPTAPGLHADGGGLYLKVYDTGSAAWSYIYKIKGRRREKGLGPYPAISLAAGRAKALALKAMLLDGIDPLETGADNNAAITFGAAAGMLIESLKSGWKNKKHGQQWTNTLKTHAADLWNMPVDTVSTVDVIKALEPIWVTKPETASRVRGRIERVLDAAKVRGDRAGDNPARWRGHLEILLPRRQILSRGHHPAMPYQQVPAFMQDLRARQALSARALEFLILTAARTGEVLNSDWNDFDLDNKLWIAPAAKMKAGKEHRVPLVDRAIEILNHVRFMNPVQPFKMSNMSMDMLLRRMDHDDFTVHGFRSAFRDWAADETDHPREIAEAALAHQVGNAVERAYRRGDALEKRRALMESWALYLG